MRRELPAMMERKQRLPVSKPAKSRAQILRAEPTPAERAMWQMLRGSRLEGLKFRRQSPIGIFIADFHCRELNLVVEVDGKIHGDHRQSAHDQNRDSYLRSLGCTILRFSNHQIFEDRESVLSKILETAVNLRQARTSQSPSQSSPLSRQGEGDRG
jgi:very-short-patch-repair endonuclease